MCLCINTRHEYEYEYECMYVCMYVCMYAHTVCMYMYMYMYILLLHSARLHHASITGTRFCPTCKRMRLTNL